MASASALFVALALMAMADVPAELARPEETTKVAGGAPGDHQGAGVALVPEDATPVGRPLSPAEEPPAVAEVVSIDAPEFVVEDQGADTTTTTTVTTLPSEPSTTPPTSTPATTVPKVRNGGGGVVAGGEDETPHKPHRPHTSQVAHCPRPPKPDKAKPEKVKPEKVKPEKVKPEKVKPEKAKPETARKGDQRAMKPVNGPKAQSAGEVHKRDRDLAQEKQDAKARRDRERGKHCADKAKKQAAKKVAKQVRESDRKKSAARDS